MNAFIVCVVLGVALVLACGALAFVLLHLRVTHEQLARAGRETDELVEAQRDLLWWAHNSMDIDQATPSDLPRIIALLDKYSDMPADFADASLVAMAERLNLSRVASVDRDFSIYRLAGKRHFENIFLRAD